MKFILAVLALGFAGFSAALLLSPELYDDVRGLIAEQTEGLELPDIDLPELEIPDIGLGSDFTVEWQGLDDYSGDTLVAIMENEDDASADSLGPIEVEIDDAGMAAVVFTDGYGDGNWKLYYWVDGNGNGTCDQGDGRDVIQRTSIASGLEAKGISYLSGFASPDDGCDRF